MTRVLGLALTAFVSGDTTLRPMSTLATRFGALSCHRSNSSCHDAQLISPSVKSPGWTTGFGLSTTAVRETPSRQVYGERRILGFSRDQIFQVVGQVDRYHAFVPWCKKSDVIQRWRDSQDQEVRLKAELVIGFPPLVGESYSSEVMLFRPHMVTSVCTDMTLFEHLKTVWKFAEAASTGDRTCALDFAVSFQFKKTAHGYVSKLFFDEVIRQNVNAFLKEAERRFGQESIPRQKPEVYAKR